MKNAVSWQSAEQLVSFLEKVVCPDAKVEHNVHLSVCGQKRTRQCDVVVRIGRAPREQVFIVEVQRRLKKPDIGTVQGWVAKMEEVGANGLICVSAAGFPSSVIEYVHTRHGDRVKLMTLSPRDHPGAVWANFYVATTVIEEAFEGALIAFDKLELNVPEASNVKLLIPMNQRIISTSGLLKDAETLADFCKRGLSSVDFPALLKSHPSCSILRFDLKLDGSEGNLWLHVEGATYAIKRWDVIVDVRQVFHDREVTLSKWAYSQQDHKGVLVWVATGDAVLSDGTTVTAELAFVPLADGHFHPKVSLRGAESVKWTVSVSSMLDPAHSESTGRAST